MATTLNYQATQDENSAFRAPLPREDRRVYHQINVGGNARVVVGDQYGDDGSGIIDSSRKVPQKDDLGYLEAAVVILEFIHLSAKLPSWSRTGADKEERFRYLCCLNEALQHFISRLREVTAHIALSSSISGHFIGELLSTLCSAAADLEVKLRDVFVLPSESLSSLDCQPQDLLLKLFACMAGMSEYVLDEP